MEKRYLGPKRFSRTREEFIAFYEEQFRDKIAEIDVEREAYKKKTVNRIIVGSIIVIVLFFFSLYDDRSFEPEEAYLKWIIYFPIFFGVMGYSAVTWMNAKSKIEDKVKINEEFIERLIERNKGNTPMPTQEKRFMSTSLLKDIVDKSDSYVTGNNLLKIYVPKETIGVYVNVVI